MSDILIVYYSLEGNVDFVAGKIAEETGADLCRLECVKEYPKKGLLKFYHGGKDVSFGNRPELKTEIPDLSGYDCVVIGAPVWAAKPAAPLNTYFDAADFTGKKVFIFASSGGGNSKKCLEIMAERVKEKGGTVSGSTDFWNPLKKSEKALEIIKSFAEAIKNR